MKKYVIIIALALLLLSCNESRRVERVMDDGGCWMSDDGRGIYGATDIRSYGTRHRRHGGCGLM